MRDGERHLLLDIDIEKHWHLYGPDSNDASRTHIELPVIQGVKFSSPVFPKPDEVLLYGEKTMQYTGQVKVSIPFHVDETLFDPESGSRELKVHYQVCGDKSVGGACLPRTSQSVSFDLLDLSNGASKEFK